MVANIVSQFLETVSRNGGSPCFHFVREGRWQRLSWKELAAIVFRLSEFLKSAGIKKGECAGIMSQSRWEWTAADLAIQSCHAITVPIYPTWPGSRIEHIISETSIRHIFVENGALTEKLSNAGLRQEIKIIEFSQDGTSPGAVSFQKIVSSVGQQPAESFKLRGEFKEDDTATIIYTSGTTGRPKGVVLTHGNIMAEVAATREIFHFEKNEIGLLCLPLSHVLGRLMQYHQLADGYQLAFLESYEKFADNCREIKPHLIVGVPRMIEKIYERLSGMLEECPKWKRRIFDWAVKTGRERAALVQKHRPIPGYLHFKYRIAKFLVFNRLLNRLGGRIKVFISGGAALSKELGKFFHALGLLILEGYGLTETFAAATVNRPDDYHFGTVGKAIPGMKIKLAPDGEILLKGPTVFREYLKQPEESARAKTADGWFCTGDIGELSRDGFLRITDRKKDLIVTSQGQNVSPQMVETLLMESRFINHCMVYGDGKKYITALITLNPDTVGEYAKKAGITGSLAEISSHRAIFELIDSIVREKNSQLARHETIKKFAILGHDFSQETGELTPTLKVRRRFTAEKYKDILESLYKE
jgi:long-chain acyl-CoA synthetase